MRTAPSAPPAAPPQTPPASSDVAIQAGRPLSYYWMRPPEAGQRTTSFGSARDAGLSTDDSGVPRGLLAGDLSDGAFDAPRSGLSNRESEESSAGDGGMARGANPSNGGKPTGNPIFWQGPRIPYESLAPELRTAMFRVTQQAWM